MYPHSLHFVRGSFEFCSMIVPKQREKGGKKDSSMSEGKIPRGDGKEDRRHTGRLSSSFYGLACSNPERRKVFINYLPLENVEVLKSRKEV